MRSKSISVGILIASTSVLLATEAHAQTEPNQEADTSPSGLADIIVTAEKRSSSLQRTPVSITALTGEDIADAQVRTLQDVQSLVPNVQIGENDGYAQITIRGIGISGFVPGAESAVAVNLNEVYVARPVAQLTSLYDISSLEVLRGPQGTLYGRNATAGSVNIISTRPTDEWSGYARAGLGSFNEIRVEGAVGGPIAGDTLLVRVAGFSEKRDGYGKNLITGNDVADKDAWGVRGTLVFAPTDNLKATLIGEYFHESDNNAALHYFGAAGLSGRPGSLGVPPLFVTLGGYTATDPQDIANAADPKFKLRTTALTGILEWDSGPVTVKSITGYRDQDSLTFTPIDGGSTGLAYYLAGEPAHQFSEELQLQYNSDRLHLTGGLYYFKEKDSSSPGVSFFKSNALDIAFGRPIRPDTSYIDFAELGGTIWTTAKAAFAQGTYEIADGLSIAGGIRFSEEKKELLSRFRLDLTATAPYLYEGDRLYDSLTPQPAGIRLPSRTFKSTTPKIGIQYQASPRTLLYATYAKGFKSGNFDISAATPAFEPEKLTDYEIGIKTTTVDNRLRANVAAFYYDYTNLQVLQIINVAVATGNAASARLYGVEAEFTALPTPDLEINLSGSWLHSRYGDYQGQDPVRPNAGDVDFTGNRLNSAPRFRAHLSAEYSWRMESGTLALRGEGDYSSKFYFTPGNYDLLGQQAFAKANAFLTYRSDKDWHVTAFVRNITDKDTRTSGVVNSKLLRNPAQGAYAPPRTYGIELGYKF